MEDKLIELLQTICPNVLKQGSLAAGEDYPQKFFTFWNNEEFEQAAYDNNTQFVVYDFDVNAYSTEPEEVYTMIKSARELLKANGWTIQSRGYDVASDEETHTGRGMQVLFLKNEN